MQWECIDWNSLLMTRHKLWLATLDQFLIIILYLLDFSQENGDVVLLDCDSGLWWAYCMLETVLLVVMELLIQGVRYSPYSDPAALMTHMRGSESTNTIHSLSPFPFPHTHTHFLPNSQCHSHFTLLMSKTLLCNLLKLCWLVPFGKQDMDRTGSLSARMKGGGGVGVTGGGRGESGESHSTPSRPYPPGIHPGGKTLILVCVYPVIMSSISADCHRQVFAHLDPPLTSIIQFILNWL